jgi:hypothetical protein
MISADLEKSLGHAMTPVGKLHHQDGQLRNHLHIVQDLPRIAYI